MTSHSNVGGNFQVGKPDQLKLLFDYTLFHIGLYATLITGLTSLVHFDPRLQNAPWLLRCIACTVLFFLLAGAAGGTIASNIPNYESFADYDQADLDVFGVPTFKYRTWEHVEHILFWLGLLVSVVGFVAAAFFTKTAVSTSSPLPWSRM
jgi:hypothetical protein